MANDSNARRDKALESIAGELRQLRRAFGQFNLHLIAVSQALDRFAPIGDDVETDDGGAVNVGGDTNAAE